MQTTLLGFAIGLILALLAALVGPYFINWNDHRAFFEAEAGRIVGVPVRVAGNIDVGILPFPSVTLGDIAIGHERETSRLRARSLRVEFGLGPLLRGEARAVEMKLIAPQFNIGLDRAGQLDWPPLALASETLSIDRLSVENGRATLTDAASGSRLVLDRFWFAGEVRSLTGPFRGKGEFVTGGGRYGYDIAAGRQGSDGMRVKLALKTDERPLDIEAEGMLAFERGVPSFDGALTLARPAGAVLASGKAVASEPWRLTSKVQAAAGSATLESVLFQYGPDERAATLSGTAEFKFGAQPQLLGRLSARQIDLDRLLATPETPRRLPLAAVQAFGDLLGGALRPSWPVNLAINVDGMTVGGAMLQQVACDLQSDGVHWSINRLEFRAPGFTQVKVQGRLDAPGKGLGFTGASTVDSNDPKSLMAWLSGRSSAAAQIKPWHASGDVTLGADRIAIERLQTDFGRGAVAGSLSYAWSAANRPARLEANLRAAEFDLDAAFGFGASAFSGLGLEAPREVVLAIEIDRARLAALEAHNVAARLTIDGNGIAIERLSIADFGSASIEASGRIETNGSPGGNIALDLNARDIDGVIALTEKTVPFLAEPLRRLAGRQKTALLHADVSVANVGTDAASGKLDLKGKIGAVRISVAASATGKRDAFTATNPRALADTDIKLDGQIEADDAATLLALLGLDRIPAGDGKTARLSLSAHGPPSRDFAFEGKLDAGPIAAAAKGALRFPVDQPAELDLDQIAGTVGGQKVQGRLALRFEDSVRADGSFEADTLDAPATIAAIIGMPARRGAADGWSTDPLDWSVPDLTGSVAFKAQRAVFAPALVAQQFHGVARFSRSELVFEEVAGEMANGHFEGRLAFSNGSEGLSARVRVGLNAAEASGLFPSAGGPAVNGRLSVQGEIEGSGRSPAAFMGSLAGFGTVTLERGMIGGLNPGVFEAVGRAAELGIPIDGDRIRPFVAGVLDTAKMPVAHTTVGVSISAGQARFDELTIPMTGAELKANATVNLSDARLDALLTLTGPPVASGSKARPTLLIALTGPALAPKRTIDTSLLASWLTLLTVEQHSRQIDAMEKAAREAVPPAPPMPVEPEKAVEPAAERQSSAPATDAGDSNAGLEIKAAAPWPSVQAPPLPPPVHVPAAPRPRAPARSAVPPRPIGQPPGLVGTQY